MFSKFILAIIPFLDLTHAQSPTSVTDVFQLPGPYIPASLEASVITSYLITPTKDISPTGVVTYLAACASAASPENDACRALSLYPAEFYHTQGSVWGGVMTNRPKSRTTSWECSLGNCGTCAGNWATCVSTIVEGVTAVKDVKTYSDECEVLHATVPLVVTAGVEKLSSYSWKGMLTDVAGHLSAYSKEASSLSCPPRPTLTAANTNGAVLTSSSRPTVSTSGSGPSTVILLGTITSSSSIQSGSAPSAITNNGQVTQNPAQNASRSASVALSSTSSRSGGNNLSSLVTGAIWLGLLGFGSCIFMEL